MTSDRLAEIEARAAAKPSQQPWYLAQAMSDRAWLLAEVRRLRAIDAGRTRYCEACEHTGRELERLRAGGALFGVAAGDLSAKPQPTLEQMQQGAQAMLRNTGFRGPELVHPSVLADRYADAMREIKRLRAIETAARDRDGCDELCLVMKPYRGCRCGAEALEAALAAEVGEL